jgi:hypothetical protein
MTAKVAMPEGLREWLANHRDELNGRFRVARRRFPQLDAAPVLGLARELLPPLPAQPDLLLSVYELVLLHAGRATLAPDGSGSVPALGVLLRETFPRITPLLLDAPRSLPGALSNAVENLGPRGAEFARRLPAVAEHLTRAVDLLDAGVVLAWRLGDARCRSAALDIAGRLPPKAALAALDLAGWPETAAPLALGALAADGWRDPATLFTPKTLKAVAARPSRIAGLVESLKTAVGGGSEEWTPAGRVGDFTGFGGPFEEPPVLLQADDRATRHRFWVRSGGVVFRVDADVYGSSCRADASVDFPVAKPVGGTKGRGKKAARPALQLTATSIVQREDLLLFTLADSFRVRVLAPPRPAL